MINNNENERIIVRKGQKMVYHKAGWSFISILVGIIRGRDEAIHGSWESSHHHKNGNIGKYQNDLNFGWHPFLSIECLAWVHKYHIVSFIWSPAQTKIKNYYYFWSYWNKVKIKMYCNKLNKWIPSLDGYKTWWNLFSNENKEPSIIGLVISMHLLMFLLSINQNQNKTHHLPPEFFHISLLLLLL